VTAKKLLERCPEKHQLVKDLAMLSGKELSEFF
jgi:hypothetical protein